MDRFLRLPANVNIREDMKYLNLNYFKNTMEQGLCAFDVVKHECPSYDLTDPNVRNKRIVVDAGHGSAQLIPRPVAHRIHAKGTRAACERLAATHGRAMRLAAKRNNATVAAPRGLLRRQRSQTNDRQWHKPRVTP